MASTTKKNTTKKNTTSKSKRTEEAIINPSVNDIIIEASEEEKTEVETLPQDLAPEIEEEDNTVASQEKDNSEKIEEAKAEEHGNSKTITTTQVYGYNHMGMIYEW